MDWLEAGFLVVFFVGLFFSIGTALLGIGHTGLDDLGLHLGGDASGIHGADGGHAGTHVSPWSVTALTAFLAFFGGIGYLALTSWHLALLVSVGLALVGGVVGWGIVYWFYSRVLVGGETRMDPADYALEGTVGRVTLPLGGDRIGEIQFTQGGARRSEGARSLDGSAIERGTEVVIVRYEGGIAYVQPWEAYVESKAPEGAEEG